MTTGIRIGHVDHAQSATLSTDSAVSSLPITNLLDPIGAKKWRTGAVTSAYILIDLGSVKSVSCISLNGHNLSASGTWRLRGSATDPTATGSLLLDIAASSTGIFPDTLPAAKRFGQPYGTAYSFFSAVSIRYIRIDLADATLSYIQAGLLLIMDPWEPTRGYSFNPSWERTDGSLSGTSRGGQVFKNRGPRQRRMRFSLRSMTPAQAWTYADELDRVAGTVDNCLVCLNVNSAYLDQMTMVGPIESSPLGWAALNNMTREYSISQRL
jgi:hypothetical protein